MSVTVDEIATAAEKKPSLSERLKDLLITLICFLPGAVLLFAVELWLMKQNAGLLSAVSAAAAGVVLNVFVYKISGVRPSWLTVVACVVMCCMAAEAGLTVRYSGYMAKYNKDHAQWYHQALDYSRAVQLGMAPEDALVYIEPKWQKEITGLLDGMAPDERKAWCYHASVAEKCQTTGACMGKFKVLINSCPKIGIKRSFIEQLRLDMTDESMDMSKSVTALSALLWNIVISKDKKRRIIKLTDSKVAS